MFYDHLTKMASEFLLFRSILSMTLSLILSHCLLLSIKRPACSAAALAIPKLPSVLYRLEEQNKLVEVSSTLSWNVFLGVCMWTVPVGWDEAKPPDLFHCEGRSAETLYTVESPKNWIQVFTTTWKKLGDEAEFNSAASILLTRSVSASPTISPRTQCSLMW